MQVLALVAAGQTEVAAVVGLEAEATSPPADVSGGPGANPHRKDDVRGRSIVHSFRLILRNIFERLSPRRAAQRPSRRSQNGSLTPGSTVNAGGIDQLNTVGSDLATL